MRPGLRPLLVPIGLALALLALGAWPAVAGQPGLVFAFRVAAVTLLAGAAWVGSRAVGGGRSLGLQFVAVRSHWVQMLVHAGLYLGWARSWPAVGEHAPHLLAQILFYYGFELLLSWLRHDRARTGFGPVPIIGSINLFLWFRDEFFVWQFAVLALGALAKTLVTWERDGRRTHVFNPASFPLFFVCVFVGLTDADVTWAHDIAVVLDNVDHAWLGIFVLGLVVQGLFAVTLMTLGAVASLAALNLAYTSITGTYAWVDVGIPAAVFLGCHFLVTDPATSPRSARGRAVFGVLYGASVFGLYLGLRELDGPAYCDKLLPVPLLNLCVRWLDRLGGPRARPDRSNGLHLALGAVLFVALSSAGLLGRSHPGTDVTFWQEACEADRWRACRAFGELLDEACHADDVARCEEYGVLRDAGGRLGPALADAGYHFTLACQKGVASACERLPAFLASGGEAALEDACDAGDGLSCLVLGSLWLGEGGVAQRPEAAHERIARACRLGVPEACDFLDP